MTHVPGQDGHPGAADGDGFLACGTPVDEVFAQVAEGRPPADPAHQRSCPFCQEALADVRDLWAPVRELAEEDVRAPAGLLDAVLARIRQLGAEPWYVTLPTAHGNVRVAARVVGAVARMAARQVPGVGLALGRAVRTDLPDDLGHGSPVVRVEVDLVVGLGAPLHRVADAVRRRIAADLARQAGIETAAVDVVVVDVRPAPPD